MHSSRTIFDHEVAVVGAGPYGLAMGAHLSASNVDAEVFGEVMSFWQHCMPSGMKLRSPWGATHLSDPDNALTLYRYDIDESIPRNQPVPLDKFIEYAKWFQRQTVPNVDRRTVKSISHLGPGFRLLLDDEAVIHARSVVIATGVTNQEFRPQHFGHLPPQLVSHTSEHRCLERFRGRSVAVVGRGLSACEYAALLRQVDADVEILCRGPIHWLTTAASRNPVRRLSKLLAAPSGVGPFPLNWIAEAPNITRHFPPPIRTAFTNRCVKPGAPGWLLPSFDGVRVDHGRSILAAKRVSDRVELRLDNRSACYDHVLLATGYRIDIAKLGILAAETLKRIRQTEGSPQLSAEFESSLPGLYFVGPSAVRSFGPLVRFIAGSAYTARAVARALVAAHSVRERTVKGTGKAVNAGAA